MKRVGGSGSSFWSCTSCSRALHTSPRLTWYSPCLIPPQMVVMEQMSLTQQNHQLSNKSISFFSYSLPFCHGKGYGRARKCFRIFQNTFVQISQFTSLFRYVANSQSFCKIVHTFIWKIQAHSFCKDYSHSIETRAAWRKCSCSLYCE